MSSSRRVNRMGSLIRGELAKLLIEEVADPAIATTTITDVELSADLKQARVFFECHAPLASPVSKEIKKGFDRAAPFLKKRLADRLELRYVPALEFQQDEHVAQVDRLMHLLDEVHPHD